MLSMPNMLAYTIQGGGTGPDVPEIIIGDRATGATFRPANPAPDTYWIAIFDANNPKTLVKDFLIPGSSNSTVPAGLDAYMSNPQYIFALTTQQLTSPHVPQGDWYDYLVKYGAGRELQRMEQLSSTLSCGSWGFFGYVLTGSCGPRGANIIPPPTYELSTVTQSATVLAMSLMPMPNGAPPYSLCDSYTFKSTWGGGPKIEGSKKAGSKTESKTGASPSETAGSKPTY